MKLEPVVIPCETGALAGLRYVPTTPHRRALAIVYAHGFTSGKYSLDGLAGYLAGRGYEGLTFDMIGHKLGASGGEMRHAAQAGENLRAALHWFAPQTDAPRVVLVGHSMGGAAALWTAAETRKTGEKEAGEKDTGARETEHGNGTGKLAGVACLCIGMEPSRGFDSPIGQAMLHQRRDYVAGAPALDLLTELDTLALSAREVGPLPTLFIAARQDVLVPVARVEALAALVGPTASVTQIDASHLEAPDRARATLAQWLETLA